MSRKAIVIGNSDGIGLAITHKLLKQGWEVLGLSRSGVSIDAPSYKHIIARVQDGEYLSQLKTALDEMAPVDICLYCAGIGKELNLSDMRGESEVVDVNLMGMIKTASVVIPMMVELGKGHFIGLSSMADEMLSAESPSYCASKAGFSTYLESLALALRSKDSAGKATGVQVTNVRFGFVDTKMAKGDVRPFMMSADRAVQHLLSCIEKKPVRYTAPKIVIPLVKLLNWVLKLSNFFGGNSGESRGHD